MRPQNNLLGILIGSDYGILNNIFVNLDSEFLISIKQNIVHIQANPKHLQGFFGKNITSVCGIVGPNGVGKTTLLNYIKSLFIKEKSELRYREDDIVFFKQEDKILVYLNVNRKLDIDILNDTHCKIEVLTYHEYPKVFNTFKNKTTVFYANGLDLDQRDTETTNYFDISTSYLLNHPGKINYRQKSIRLKRMNTQKRFRYTELRRQAEFLQSLAQFNYKIPFKKQLYIEVEISEVLRRDYDKLLKTSFLKFNEEHTNKDGLRDFLDLVHDLKYVAADWKEKVNSEAIREIQIGENILFQLSSTIINEWATKNDDSYFRILGAEFNNIFRYLLKNEHFNLKRLDELFEYLEAQLTQVHELEGTRPTFTDNGIKRIGELKQMLRFSLKLLSNIQRQKYIDVIPLEGKKVINLIDEFFSSDINEFVNLKWPKMSAGEDAMLSFYSRLQAVIENIKTDDLLLLIDEGDLYFHPEWQRKYLFYLLNFLKTTNLQIQVVYTTHSPFLISDLPRENIVLLGQNRPNEDFETFGANLYTLFSKAFFLGEHTTSEFARLKIKTEILDKITDGNQGVLNLKLENLIDKIGEPVLKTLILNRVKKNRNDKS